MHKSTTYKIVKLNDMKCPVPALEKYGVMIDVEGVSFPQVDGPFSSLGEARRHIADFIPGSDFIEIYGHVSND